jgi:hypothetical protein
MVWVIPHLGFAQSRDAQVALAVDEFIILREQGSGFLINHLVYAFVFRKAFFEVDQRRITVHSLEDRHGADLPVHTYRQAGEPERLHVVETVEYRLLLMAGQSVIVIFISIPLIEVLLDLIAVCRRYRLNRRRGKCAPELVDLPADIQIVMPLQLCQVSGPVNVLCLVPVGHDLYSGITGLHPAGCGLVDEYHLLEACFSY